MKQNWRPERARCFIAFLSFPLLVSLSACQSDKPTIAYPPPDELTLARTAQIPTPAVTPFDATAQLRAEYLEAYQDGYRSGLTGMNISFRKPPAGASNPRSQGWRDGADAGLKEYFYRKNRQ